MRKFGEVAILADTMSFMPRGKGTGSRADVVTASLRDDILAGRLRPGQRLTFPELCREYSVSVGVLREALVRLVDRGIVRAESNLGFRVMSLSEVDLDGLTAVRAHIEPAFVRDAVLTGSRVWEATVLATHHLIDGVPRVHGGRLNEDLVRAHAEFHLALVSGADNRRMTEIVSRLRDETDLYFRWFLDLDRIAEHGERVAEQDRAILAAVLARDAERAEVLVRDHIQDTFGLDGAIDASAAEPA